MSWLKEFFEPEIAAVFDSGSITSRKVKLLLTGEKRKKYDPFPMPENERRRVLVNSTFTLLACFAKADFFIARREASLLHHLIKVELAMTPEAAQKAVYIFNRIQNIHDVESEAHEQIRLLARAWMHDANELQRIFNMCLGMSLCHSNICYQADKFLLKLIKDFELHPINYMPIREQFLHPQAEAYHHLQIATMVDKEQIKLAWRRLCSLYHPDKMVNADASKKAWAEEKLQQINEAYKILKK